MLGSMTDDHHCKSLFRNYNDEVGSVPDDLQSSLYYQTEFENTGMFSWNFYNIEEVKHQIT